MSETTSPPGPANESTPALSMLFVAGLGKERRAEFGQDAALEQVLHKLLAEARALCPAVDASAFLAFVAGSLSAQVRDCAELGTLRVGDLLVVYGYGREDPGASEVIERQYLPQIERSLHSYGLSDLDLAEIRQLLRHRLWASHEPQKGSAPYSGRGELLGWLRVTALREAKDMAQRHRGRVEVSEQESIEAGHVAGSAELQLLKSHYRQEFGRAFNAAMAALSSKDRNLLRYTYIDNLGIDEIAAIYKVHRATAARWINQTREALQKQTRKNLQQQGSLAGVNLDELLQLIWSQIDVSIRHHLQLHTD